MAIRRTPQPASPLKQGDRFRRGGVELIKARGIDADRLVTKRVDAAAEVVAAGECDARIRQCGRTDSHLNARALIASGDQA